MDIFEKVEIFLNKIHKDEIVNYPFYLYGFEEEYKKVKSYNNGYLPFYINKDLKITQNFLPKENTLNRPGLLREKTKYVVIHDAGLASPLMTAKGLDQYLHTTTRQASWHYSVDDKEVYQELPLEEVAWHAGDGRTSYPENWLNDKGFHLGGGNYTGIGIETCVYKGVNFNQAMRNVAKLTAWLLIKYGLSVNDVKQHNDFSGKNCPETIRTANRWDEFIELVNLEYYKNTKLADVELEFISLDPQFLDNEGNVLKHPLRDKIVSYEVKANYQGETRTFKYQTKIKKLLEVEL